MTETDARVELVVEPRPELPAALLAQLRAALAERDEIARAYLLRQRRTVAGAEPQLVTALSLVLAEPPAERADRERATGVVVELASSLGEAAAELAIGVPAPRALPEVERHGVLVYERS